MSSSFESPGRIFSPDGFAPGRVGGPWPDWLAWEHVGGDALVGLACVAMSLMIWRLGVRRRDRAPSRGIVLAFALFIGLLGLGHFLDTLAFFRPMDRLSGHVLVATGLVSGWTVWSIRKAWPSLMGSRGPADREGVIAVTDIHQHQRAEELIRESEERLLILNQSLGRRVQERTAELTAANESLLLSEERFRGAFDAAAIGMALVAPDGRWLQVNQSLLKIVGYSEVELLAKTFQDITHPDDLMADLDQFHAVITGEIRSYRMEKRYFHKEGRVIWVMLSVSLVRDAEGRPLHFVSQIEDVTTRKEFEEDLRRARDDAMAATRAKGDFLANMSHEIRTPMNGVIGMTELLLGTQLDRPQRDYAETIRNSGEALLTVINDILDFSKIEAGKLTIQVVEFTPSTLIEEVADLLAPGARQKGLEIRCRVDPKLPTTLRGDPIRIRQVLTNLAGNAVKFTHRGTVDLEASPIAEAGDEVTLRVLVRDSGIGIPADRQSDVFESFTQVEGGSRRRHGGTGLGLTICRSLVGLMGGRIGLESTPGEGSTFWFELTLGRGHPGIVPGAPPAIEARPADSSTTRPIHARVLMAEDNEVNRRVAIGMLDRLGCTVDAVENGRLALEALDYDRHDLLLMDIQMPEMDGLSASAAIREREKASGEHIPIVALTAHAMKGDREKCLEAGMDDYVAKPLRPASLREILQTWASGRKRRPGAPRPVGPTREGATCVEYLRETCGNDPQLIAEVLGLMLEGTPEQLDRLEAAVNAGDGRQVAWEAHALKGAFLTVGAEALGAACEELMALGDRADLLAFESAYRPIRDQWEHLKNDLRSQLDAPSATVG